MNILQFIHFFLCIFYCIYSNYCKLNFNICVDLYFSRVSPLDGETLFIVKFF